MARRWTVARVSRRPPVRLRREQRCQERRARLESGNGRRVTRAGSLCIPEGASAIVGEGQAIRIPKGRTQIDWECELGVVVSKMASQVPVAQAANYIFGYTNEMDVSDREGRGDSRYGSDWLIGKSHDTFAPMGPFITPKEFVSNPQNLPVKFSLNGKLMQDATTQLMIHDVFELVWLGSSIMTLRPGDVIATGTRRASAPRVSRRST